MAYKNASLLTLPLWRNQSFSLSNNLIYEQLYIVTGYILVSVLANNAQFEDNAIF